MNHVSEERLIELGMDPARTANAEEASHLTSCPDCARGLEAERRLTRTLLAIPRTEAPAGFADATTKRFVAALEARRTRRLTGMVVAALLAGSLLALPMAALLVANARAVIRDLAIVIEKCVVLGHAAGVVLEKVPFVSFSLVCAACTVALLSAWMTSRLAHEVSVVK